MDEAAAAVVTSPASKERLMKTLLVFLVAMGLPVANGVVAAQTATPAGAQRIRADFLRVIDRPRAPLAPSAATTSTANGYQQEVLSFQSGPGERVPTLILRKDGAAGRRAAVIVLHGTGGSKEDMRELLESYAGAGFIAVAIDAPYHGERATPIPGLADAYQSAMLRKYRTGEKNPYLYDTVWDVMRLIDYLSTRSDVDPSRIGLVGYSKGGTEAYLAAAVDERIAVVAPWIGVQSFGWSLRRPAGWEARISTFRSAVEAAAAEAREPVNAAFVRKFYDRVAPGLVDKFDGPAMLPLIAPRPLIVVNGELDPRSPLGGVREAVAAAEKAYVAAGARDNFRFVLQENAGHEVTAAAQEATYQWLVRFLPRR